MLTIFGAILISSSLLVSVRCGVICPVPHIPPLMHVVPIVPVVGVFELFGPFEGVSMLPPVGLAGKFGGFNGGIGNQGVYGMSMHKFMPKMGSFQYPSYDYNQKWNGYPYGPSGGQSYPWGGNWNYQSPVTPNLSPVTPVVNSVPATGTGTPGGTNVVWSWNEPNTNIDIVGLQTH